ncbi:hypothetical protein BDM02DRAFT_703128 [Thelephora ganbajun]|uniref:Uncharacterized protein n=1 Tax=Thelephora ganbajun TaxID=370292 RepID=A0ACB6Z628_THEGA|nr:hypothetical protein BDM02DRAFT_703128 [Thelephora ganbajun]
MESLPLMLQVALLLLGCALSRYLWEIDTTVASVVIGVTSLGVLFCFFIAFAGAIYGSCPYQTPAANIIRHVLGVICRVPCLLRSARALFVEHSILYYGFVDHWHYVGWISPAGIIVRILTYPLVLLKGFVADAFRLGQAILWTLVISVHRAHSWLFGTSPVQNQALYDQATRLDFHCILWMLQTSLDKTIVVVDCFNILSNCFVTGGGERVTVTRGSEQLAGISVTCFLRAFSCLLSTEPTSTVIRDIRQRYNRVFPYFAGFEDIPFYFSMNAIHHLVTHPAVSRFPDWRDYNPSADELIQFSRALAQAAKFEYHRREAQLGVPEWLVRFALRFLSQDLFLPASVVIDCLTIIATDLGCNVPDADSMAPGENASPEQLFALIIREYETIDPDDLRTDSSKDMATIAFLPYVARREEDGTGKPPNTPFRVAGFL